MKLALCLAAAAAALAPQEGSLRDAVRRAAPAPVGVDPAAVELVGATLTAAPSEVELGQPIELTLELAHPADVELFVKDGALALDDSWLRLEDARVVTVERPGGRLTRARWAVASLEPGERALEVLPGRYEALGALHVMRPVTATVRVRPALAAGEDAPRPAAGFRPPPEGAEPDLSPLYWSGGTLLAALLAAGALFARSRLRGAPRAAAEPTPRERLERLSAEGLDDPGRVRALHYELSAALRAMLDARAGRDRRGATDAEWLAVAAHDPGLSADAHRRLFALLETCDRVKYAQARPTRFAVEETLGAARALAAELAAGGEAAA